MRRRRPTQQLDADGQALAVDWMRLARACARIMAARAGVDRRELVGAAYLGLCLAALTYRPETGVPFGAWARHRIDRQIRLELAHLGRRPPGALPDELPDHEPDAWPDWLERAWAEMPAARRELVERRLAGEPLAAIGRDLGLTPSGVRAAYPREIDRLRARAPGDGRS